MNILDVPVQADVESDYQYSSLTPLESDLYTLDPTAKYFKLQPSVRSASWSPSQTCVGSFPPLVTPVGLLSPTRTPRKVISVYRKSICSASKSNSTQKPKSSSSPTKRFLFATYYSMRATRSAGLIGPDPKSSERASAPIPIPATSEAELIRNGSFRSVTNNIDVTSENYIQVPTNAVLHNNILQSRADKKPTLPVLGQVTVHERLSPLSLGPAEDEAPPQIPSSDESRVEPPPFFQATLRQLRRMIGFSNGLSSRRQSIPNAISKPMSNPISGQPDFSGKQVGQGEHDEFLRIEDVYSGRQNSADSTSSYATNNLFSPGLAPSSVVTDGMSPCHLSPPDTPDKGEPGHGHLGSSRPVSSYTDTHEILSTDMIETLRKSLAAANIQDKPYPGSSLHRQGSRALVTSWINGSEHLITGLGDLLDDLGYLGDLITWRLQHNIGCKLNFVPVSLNVMQ